MFGKSVGGVHASGLVSIVAGHSRFQNILFRPCCRCYAALCIGGGTPRATSRVLALCPPVPLPGGGAAGVSNAQTFLHIAVKKVMRLSTDTLGCQLTYSFCEFLKNYTPKEGVRRENNTAKTKLATV